MVGDTISQYKILSKLGEGGMGVVYKAEDMKLGRLVALKFLPEHKADSDKDTERFMQEARTASALNHPNVCTIYDIKEEDDRQFIVMEYVDGKTLRDLIQEKQLDYGETVGYALQIGEALNAAHEKEIVHRDVKTENIMITKNNQVKVMDFGLAKLKGAARQTKTMSTVGTLAYMSPEQIKGDKVDTRSDIFSFGVVFFEMLTGRTAFRGEYNSALMYSILNEAPQSLQEFRPDASNDFSEVINKALEKEVEYRYQSISGVLSDLKRLKRDTGKISLKTVDEIKASKSSSESFAQRSDISSTKPATPSKRKRLIKPVLYAAGAAILFIAVFILLFQKYKDADKIELGQSQKLTYAAGMEIDPELSPDGKMIAFSSGTMGQTHLFIRQITGGRTIALTEGLNGDHRLPKWSPDGTKIAFQSKGSVYIVPSLGGNPKLLIENASCPAWSPDGKQIAYVRGRAIYTQLVYGGESKKITDVKSPAFLSWSPNGQLITCSSGNYSFIGGNIAASSVCVVSVKQGNPIFITDRKYLNTCPVWMPDGKNILYISDRDGSRDVYKISISKDGKTAGKPERITTNLNPFILSLSSDGKKLAYSLLTNSQNIWKIRIPDEEPVSAAEAKPVTTGNQKIEGFDVSLDGNWLTFDSNLRGNQDIYKMSLVSKDMEPEQLTTNRSIDFIPSWSPDGKTIAFYSFRNGNRDIYLISSNGTSLQQLTDFPAAEQYPDWSPDSKSLVFTSGKTGRIMLYIISKKNDGLNWGEPRQLTFNGGFFPKWSPDGKLIAYWSGNGISVIPPEGGTSRKLIQHSDPSSFFPAWSPDSKTVYFKAKNKERNSSIWSVPVSGGIPKLLVKFDDPARKSNRPEFTTDGQHFYFTITDYQSDIWLLNLLNDK